MHQYLLALGANLGDREYYIEQAIEAIRTSCGPILRRASLFETAPWGESAQHSFLNTALICQSTSEPLALLRILLTIEASLGRVRKDRWGDRTIDCDIILWRRFPELQAQLIHTPELVIPHPEAERRTFVLQPAAEIAGDWLHPTSGLSIQQLWLRLSSKDSSGI